MSERSVTGITSEVRSFLYEDFSRIRLKAFRNGNWRRLNDFEKALFNASMQLARIRGRVVNPFLVKAVKNIVLKLVQTPLIMITLLSKEQASKLFRLYRKNGVLKRIPKVRSWLKDPEYLLWLGVKQLTLRSIGYS